MNTCRSIRTCLNATSPTSQESALLWDTVLICSYMHHKTLLPVSPKLAANKEDPVSRIVFFH